MRTLDDLAEATVAAPAAEMTPVSELRARASKRRHRRLTASLGALLGVVVLIGAAILLRSEQDSSPRITTATPRPARTIPDLPKGIPQPTRPSQRVKARIHGFIGRTVVYGDTYWILSYPKRVTSESDYLGRLVAIDSRTMRTRGEVAIRDRWSPIGVAASRDGVWILTQRLDGSPYHVMQIDPTNLSIRREVDLPGTAAYGSTNPPQIVATSGAAWIGQVSLYRVDANTGEVKAVAALPQASKQRMVADAHSVWFAGDQSNPQVVRIDAETGAIIGSLTAGDPGYTWSLAVDPHAAWLTAVYQIAPGQVVPRLVRIDARTYDTRVFDIPAISVAAGDGQVWVQLYDNEHGILNETGLVGELNQQTGDLMKTIRLPVHSVPTNGPTFSVANGSLWAKLQRVTP